MYPRTNYEISEQDLQDLLEACKSTSVMMIGSYAPASPQENANRAWENLGKKMGFDYNTVQPIEGKSNKFFSAIPSETEYQRSERIKTENQEAKLTEIKSIEEKLKELNSRLEQLKQ